MMDQKQDRLYGNFPLTLAPMVGLSHLALRRLIRRYTPENALTLWPTEMLNSRRLPMQLLGETPETLRDPDESGLNPQILGNEEQFITPSLKKLEDWGASAVDINMGCPVRRALKHNYGVALMGDPSYAQEIVRMTVRNTRLPVSVKLRSGQSRADENNLLKFVEGLQQSGASWICLHPRFGEDKRRGRADWPQIKMLRQNLDLPIIGNGDVQTAEDALAMLDLTGCDKVMIGRALTARPWLFWQVGERLGFPAPKDFPNQKAPQGPEEEAYAYGEAVLFFIQTCRELFEENQAIRKVRFYLSTSHVWLNFGHSLLSKSMKAKTLDDIESAVRTFFQSSGLRMSQKTELRN